MKQIAFLLGIIAMMALCLPGLAAQSSYSQDLKIVANYLDARIYDGDSRVYDARDLQLADRVVDRALGRLGVSAFTLHRNEIFARHGYVFKTEILSSIFSATGWYRPDPKVGLTALGKREQQNVDFIKSNEDGYDFKLISTWLNGQAKLGTDRVLLFESDFEPPQAVWLALNHLEINPARILRNLIYAQGGYVFQSTALARIFKACAWYSGREGDQSKVYAKLNKYQQSNLQIIQAREWNYLVEAVSYSVPDDVTVIPVLGSVALFVRNIPLADGSVMHYSTRYLYETLAFDPAGIDGHRSDPDAQVSPEIQARIRAEPLAAKKLQLFFEHKAYAGIMDKRLVNPGDLVVPSYLAPAVSSLGLEWPMLLRKEIHARRGAIFTDPKLGDIFRACSWYKARFKLDPSTLSRLPAAAKASAIEAHNYCLLEGEEMSRLWAASQRDDGSSLVLDLFGNRHYVYFETLLFTDEGLKLGYDGSDAGGLQPPLRDAVQRLLDGQNIPAEEYDGGFEYGGGC